LIFLPETRSSDLSLPFGILYEDNHLIAVNKPVNLLVQGDRTGDPVLAELVREYLREKYKKPGNVFLGVTHRLDRPVSGVVLMAKTGKALSRVNEMFRKKQVKKTYWAIVKDIPRPEEGTLRHYMIKNREQNKSIAYDHPMPGSREAILHYRLVKNLKRCFLLEIDLETGRHHQIRAQLAAIGCPVMGDLKYGYPGSNPGGDISLHARRLSLQHPVKNAVLNLEAPPPDDSIWQSFL